MHKPSAPLVLETGSLRLGFRPEVAGRVVEFSLEGVDALSPASKNPSNYGSTYWTSPQADWGWPPVSEIDSAAFASEADSERARLVGPPGPLGLGRVRLTKEYCVAIPGRSMDLRYHLDNVGDAPVRAAGWEISRVPPGGLTFFPTGSAELTPIAPHAELLLIKTLGLSYYDHRHFALGPSRKVHADGREGFLAHVVRGDREALLFLKTFDDQPPEAQAPGEGEVELFANEDGAYVEVEVQGPYVSLLPGQRATLAVRWTLVPLELGLAEPAQLERLAEVVRALAHEVGRPRAAAP